MAFEWTGVRSVDAERHASAEGFTSGGCFIAVIVSAGKASEPKEYIGWGESDESAVRNAVEMATGADLAGILLPNGIIPCLDACVDAANLFLKPPAAARRKKVVWPERGSIGDGGHLIATYEEDIGADSVATVNFAT